MRLWLRSMVAFAVVSTVTGALAFLAFPLRSSSVPCRVALLRAVVEGRGLSVHVRAQRPTAAILEWRKGEGAWMKATGPDVPGQGLRFSIPAGAAPPLEVRLRLGSNVSLPLSLTSAEGGLSVEVERSLFGATIPLDPVDTMRTIFRRSGGAPEGAERLLFKLCLRRWFDAVSRLSSRGLKKVFAKALATYGRLLPDPAKALPVGSPKAFFRYLARLRAQHANLLEMRFIDRPIPANQQVLEANLSFIWLLFGREDALRLLQDADVRTVFSRDRRLRPRERRRAMKRAIRTIVADYPSEFGPTARFHEDG